MQRNGNVGAFSCKREKSMADVAYKPTSFCCICSSDVVTSVK